MARLDPNNPTHQSIRGGLRVFGPVIFLVGLIFVIVGVASLFATMGSHSFEGPRYFWCAFVGIPLLAIGGAMTQFGYVGSILRYFAEETAPVGSETANYVADEVRPAIKSVTSAVVEGIREGRGAACARCQTVNDSDAKFCKSCGSPI